MTVGLVATAACGFAAAYFCASAARAAYHERRKRLRRMYMVVVFWVVVASYMAVFALLRIANLLDLPGQAALFYLQTVAGASTVVALAFILIGVAFGHHWARLGAEVAAVAAAIVLTLVFADGLKGPMIDAWSVEYIPGSPVARGMIAAVYIAAPIAMSSLAVWATHASDRAFRLKSLMFSASVVLMYVPNAIKYVGFVTGPLSVAMAVVMCGGALIGWRSHVA